MKKMLMSLAAIVAIGFGANAQRKGDVSFGVKGGLNISAVVGNPARIIKQDGKRVDIPL